MVRLVAGVREVCRPRHGLVCTGLARVVSGLVASARPNVARLWGVRPGYETWGTSSPPLSLLGLSGERVFRLTLKVVSDTLGNTSMGAGVRRPWEVVHVYSIRHMKGLRGSSDLHRNHVAKRSIPKGISWGLPEGVGFASQRRVGSARFSPIPGGCYSAQLRTCSLQMGDPLAYPSVAFAEAFLTRPSLFLRVQMVGSTGSLRRGVAGVISRLFLRLRGLLPERLGACAEPSPWPPGRPIPGVVPGSGWPLPQSLTGGPRPVASAGFSAAGPVFRLPPGR